MIDIVSTMRNIVLAMEPIDAVAARHPGSDGKPFYMAGHMLEITNRLIKKTADVEEKYKKFPLIVLHLDVPQPIVDNVVQLNLQMLIVTKTEKFKNAEQRQEEVFNPILAPIYNELIKQIVYSGQFMWPGDPERPPHTPIERPYFGYSSGDTNIKNKITDPLDAIEILNLKLNKVIC